MLAIVNSSQDGVLVLELLHCIHTFPTWWSQAVPLAVLAKCCTSLVVTRWIETRITVLIFRIAGLSPKSDNRESNGTPYRDYLCDQILLHLLKFWSHQDNNSGHHKPVKWGLKSLAFSLYLKPEIMLFMNINLKLDCIFNFINYLNCNICNNHLLFDSIKEPKV